MIFCAGRAVDGMVCLNNDMAGVFYRYCFYICGGLSETVRVSVWFYHWRVGCRVVKTMDSGQQ